MKNYKSIYHMENWDESPILSTSDGRKVTKVQAGFRHEGSINGKTTLVFCMFYETAATGRYEGYEYFEGTFEGKPSTIWLSHMGVFDEKLVQAKVETVQGTGTGGLMEKLLGFAVVFEGQGPYHLEVEVQ